MGKSRAAVLRPEGLLSSWAALRSASCLPGCEQLSRASPSALQYFLEQDHF